MSEILNILRLAFIYTIGVYLTVALVCFPNVLDKDFVENTLPNLAAINSMVATMISEWWGSIFGEDE